MKNLPLSFFFFLFSPLCFAQNLVPNPGFEQYDSCPNSYSQIQFATGWWSARETPDYFNICGTGLAGIPYNGMGFQEADSGQGYSGLLVFVSNGNLNTELISTALFEEMKENYYYKVGFSTNRADGIVNRRLASNNLGILFSTIKYESPAIFPTINFSHFKIDSVITDTTNWLQVAFSFQADSEYKYITIGNFYSNDLTDTILYEHGGAKAYYYIDNVYVIEDTSNAVNKLLTKNIHTYIPESNQLVIENAKGNNIQIIDSNGSVIFEKENIESDKYIINLILPFFIIVLITSIASVLYIKKHINPKNQ